MLAEDDTKTVLVVDDTPENIDILKGILGPYFSVRAATSGETALKAARAGRRPDLILLDVMMAGMDGYEVCRQLKADEHSRHVPVIFVTARSSPQDEAYGFSIGAADYIIKPVSPPVVLARVRTHLALADRSRHLEELVAERTEKLLARSRELEHTRLEILRRLGRAGEYRDYETGMHVIRLSQFARLLAETQGMGSIEAEQLMYASMLHDIGKIGIPDDILLKPGRLSAEEFALMKTHCRIGADIIGTQDCALLQLAAQIALTHHERWDGGGYPAGLAAEHIPLAGRITAVADIFDALTSKRPYKDAWPVERALDHIAGEAGKALDPRLAHAFVARKDAICRIIEQFREHAD
ncbi:HD-GYP domain-containing protein [Pseudothauera lacus]|uniref:Two-component system response regulator n=1 Tax=Pseudothauera lacus TaxID=2136175 RepID=A0A2T4IID6_9RHOO|nr:HD domain-containing phosphohydrolase [Pseudothauera lacus]PTD97528.1 two-component system response regulator [Pseudothauera lacus]